MESRGKGKREPNSAELKSMRGRGQPALSNFFNDNPSRDTPQAHGFMSD